MNDLITDYVREPLAKIIYSQPFRIAGWVLGTFLKKEPEIANATIWLWLLGWPWAFIVLSTLMCMN